MKRGRWARAGLAAAVASTASAATPSAHARPQLEAAATTGVAGVGDRSTPWKATRFASGLRADALFLRERDLDPGFGPYVEVLSTTSFHDVQLGGGATALLPVHPYLPVVLSLGPYGRRADGGAWEPGIAGALFWGSRSYNYHASYGLAAGLLLEARYGLGDSRELTFIVAAQLDLAFLAMPFLFAYEAIRKG